MDNILAQTICSVLSGVIGGMIFNWWLTNRENKKDLKSLLILAYIRINVFTETLRIITEESQDIHRHCPPSLGMDAKQVERLFVLSENRDIMLFIARTDAFCAFCQSLDPNTNLSSAKQAETQVLLSLVIQDCEQCLKNIYSLFEKKFSPHEAMYYLPSNDATKKRSNIKHHSQPISDE